MADESVRLQKLLAQAGIGSRRYCEILIERGRVTVNGAVVSELGARATWEDEIRVDGVLVVARPESLTYAFNKPRGVVSAMSDERKKSLADYVEQLPHRLFHVGRLDEDTEGLLILTNDGDLAQRLAHPSNEISKTYLATVAGEVKPGTLRKLLSGVELEDGEIKCDRAVIKDRQPGRTLLEVQIHSGRNRIVRRMLAKVGHPVQKLVRTHIGQLGLDGLKPGSLRELSTAELRQLSQNANW